MKAKLKILAFKMEATYNTDPVPTAAANVIAAENVEINPLKMDVDTIDVVSNSFGGGIKVVAATWASIKFSYPLCGGGAPRGTAPNHGPLKRAAGWAQTVTASTNVTYSLVSTGEESVACYYWNDGVLYKMLGIRGSISEDWTARKAPRGTFEGMGLVVPVVDQAMPTPTEPSIPRPVAVNKANTTLTIGGYAVRMASFTWAQGNEVVYNNRTGREDVQIGGRQFSGKAVFEMPLVAEMDFLGANGLCTLATPVAMSIVHGSAIGNTLTRTLPKVQLFNPNPRDEGGIVMLECDVHIAKTGSNDEMTCVYT